MQESKEQVFAQPMKKIAETYEAPRVETVLTAEDMEREVHYAGNGITKVYN